MKKIKLLTSALGITLTMAMSTPVFASGNISDTNLPTKKVDFTLSSAANTSLCAKTDASSHYIYNKSGFDLWVISKDANGTNQTLKSYVIIPSGTERKIQNYVYEHNKRSCYLNISSAKSGVSGYVKGLWSPDSVGSYPVAGH